MSEDPEVPRMSEPVGDESPGDRLPERKEPGPVPLIPPINSGENPEQGEQTGILPSGFTGALEESAEALEEPDLKQAGSDFHGRLESIEAKPEPYPEVKRRSITGQLGAFVTGLLRGSPAEGGPARAERKRTRSGVDEDVSELREHLERDESGRSQKPGETGELLHSFTGALRWVTNPRNLTGFLFRRGGTGQLELPEKPIPPLERSEAEIEEGGLTGRLGQTLAAEPPGRSEPEDFVIELGPGEPIIISPPEIGEQVEPAPPEDLGSRLGQVAGEREAAADQPFVSFEEAEQPAAPPELPERPFMSFSVEESLPAESAPVETAPPVPPLQPDQPGEEPARAKGSGSLLKRVTGSLRRITGPLQETGEGSQEPHPAGKRRRVTGQLGSIITGILRGGKEEGERKPDQAEIDGYVSELRQNLATEEANQPKPVGRTGRLIQSITGPLRRITGPLGWTGRLVRREQTGQPEQPEETPPLEPVEAEIEQDILAGRLSTASIAEPSAWVEPEDFVIELESGEPFGEPLEGSGVSPEVEGDLLAETEGNLEPGLQTAGGDSGALLESGAADAIEQTEQQVRPVESGQDWVAELRDETAEADAADVSLGSDRPGSVTARLKNFITGVLRRPEEKKTGSVEPVQEGADLEERALAESPGEVSDDLVSGRLDRSLGIAGEEALQPDLTLDFLAEEPVVPSAGESSLIDEETILADLESRFEQVSGGGAEEAGELYTSFEDQAQPFTSFEDTVEPYSSSDETDQPYRSFSVDQAETYDATRPSEPPIPFVPVEPQDLADLSGFSPEDEQLIWGEQEIGSGDEGRTIRAEDFWDQIKLSRDQGTGPSQVSEDDFYAATFLAGTDAVPQESAESEISTSLVPELPHGKGSQEPFEDIRSIVLEDLPVEERPQVPVAIALPGEQAVEEEPAVPEAQAALAPAPAVKWTARLAALPLMHKILIVEAILVGIALIIAVPYFLSLMLRGPAEVPPTNFLAPRALPAGVPYPTGITLPGGWYFKLGKSTFDAGEWKPAGAEWLEGTELRRVVALPWNPQTEAVVQSFQAGDVVELYLSNSNSIRYKITRVERVPVDQVRVYTDLRPSLAIILYREDTDERWVVISQR